MRVARVAAASSAALASEPGPAPLAAQATGPDVEPSPHRRRGASEAVRRRSPWSGQRVMGPFPEGELDPQEKFPDCANRPQFLGYRT